MDPRSQRQPWQEMRRLQDRMEQMFAGLSPALRWPLTGEYPPINITRDDDGISLEALCPGVDRESIDVTVVGEVVTIRGQRSAELENPQGRFHRRERPAGAFARAISLGEPLDADRAEARYHDGVLRVRLARAPEAKPRKIEIAH